MAQPRSQRNVSMHMIVRITMFIVIILLVIIMAFILLLYITIITIIINVVGAVVAVSMPCMFMHYHVGYEQLQNMNHSPPTLSSSSLSLFMVTVKPRFYHP